MKNVLIAGASGMIGQLVLQNCLNDSTVNKVTSITRKPSGIKHERLIEVLHGDFLDFSKVKDHFKNQDCCFYCVGVYTGQVPTDEFRKITIGFTKAFADQLKRNSPEVSFSFLSGAGADSSETSRILFAKEKGIAENYLLSLNFRQLSIFRPAYIYPVAPRIEPNFGYKVMRLLYKPLSIVYPNGTVTSVKLASKMTEVGLYGSTQIIYENRDIRQ